MPPSRQNIDLFNGGPESKLGPDLFLKLLGIHISSPNWGNSWSGGAAVAA